jgi:hypothetical protein
MDGFDDQKKKISKMIKIFLENEEKEIFLR